MQGLPYLKLLAATLVLTVVISVIMLIPDWNGVQGSTAANDIDRLLDISIVLSSFVFSIVMVLLGFSIYKWRAKPGDESDGGPDPRQHQARDRLDGDPHRDRRLPGRDLLDRPRRHRGQGSGLRCGST